MRFPLALAARLSLTLLASAISAPVFAQKIPDVRVDTDPLPDQVWLRATGKEFSGAVPNSLVWPSDPAIGS